MGILGRTPQVMSCWEVGMWDGSFDTGLRNTAEAMMSTHGDTRVGAPLSILLGVNLRGEGKKTMISVSREDFAISGYRVHGM